ncbi:MAG: hypothetical protein A4S12_00925 [Proteobacteria bacterium SG_bin5]|nr:MAG: hypothetical protein A4S12_00925 [Proteobacteria bacterium SG_bin5]
MTFLILVPGVAQAEFAPRGGLPIDLPRGAIDLRVTPPGPAPWQDLRAARGAIREERDAGRLSRAEARALRREAWVIGAALDRAAADGLSASEAAEIEQRSRALQSITQAPGRRR